MIASVYDPPNNVAGYDPHRDAEGYWFDANEAVRRIKFFETGLTHTKGHLKGKPFTLEDWEKAIIATLFGWKREDGTRRYRECFIFIPRKNGKSTIAAGITLCVLYCDGEGAAECYCVAGDLDQTDMVYGTAAAMVRQSKALDSRSKVRDSRKRIIYGDSFFRAIPADDKGAHGFNLHFVCGDELHTWPNRDLKDTLHTGTGFRQQPLEVYITTAGFELNSIAGETYQYACKVRDGQIKDATFLPVIYEAPKDWDWKEEKTWAKANPNYGVSVRRDYIAAECKKAIENPAYENTFRRLHLNQWCVTRETLITLASGKQLPANQLRVGDIVCAFDEATGAIRKAPVVAVAPMSPSPIVEIKTARGRLLRTNAHHPYWCRLGRPDNPKYGWVVASKLKIGSRVGVALDHSRLPRGVARINAATARFLGVFAGDGNCNGSPRLTSVDPEIISFSKDFIESLGDRFAPLPDGVHFDARNTTKTLKRTATRKLLQRCGMWRTTCRDKSVPHQVWIGGPKAWAAFLSGYLDTDGHVSNGAIIWVSTSEDLLRGCQQLLAYLGIQSKVTAPDKCGRGRLEVLDAVSFDTAAETLSPLVARKREALNALVGKRRLTGPTASDRRNFDWVTSIEWQGDEETIGITVDTYHTHITNGLITHNTEQKTRWLKMDDWRACRVTDERLIERRPA